MRHRMLFFLLVAGLLCSLMAEQSQDFSIEPPDNIEEPQIVLSDAEEPEAVYDLLMDHPVPASAWAVDGGELYREQMTMNDTLIAPFFFVTPLDYNPEMRYPLLVFLHGGVGRPEFPAEQEFQEAIKSGEYPRLAVDTRADGFFRLIPLARYDCMWWDETGIQNILAQVRYMKARFMIDDNRVWIGGFSDGASGSFHLAMNRPDVFAGFIPMSGMVSVGPYMTKQGSFPVNLAGRPLFVTNTDQDGLYPAEATRRQVAKCLEAGGDILYQEFFGFGHDNAYVPMALDAMYRFLDRCVRNPFPERITWECDDVKNGACDWLRITKLDTLQAPKEWHVVYRDSIPNRRITFGFLVDPAFEGTGVRVAHLSEEESPASECGLQAGDVIVRINDTDVVADEDVFRAKQTMKRGDPFSLEVERDGRRVTLMGQLPSVAWTPAFTYPRASGRVDARFYGNVFEVKTSRVGAFELLIHPLMVRMENPVVVIVNGVEVFRDHVRYDTDFMLKGFQETLDREALFVGRIPVEVR